MLTQCDPAIGMLGRPRIGSEKRKKRKISKKDQKRQKNQKGGEKKSRLNPAGSSWSLENRSHTDQIIKNRQIEFPQKQFRQPFVCQNLPSHGKWSTLNFLAFEPSTNLGSICAHLCPLQWIMEKTGSQSPPDPDTQRVFRSAWLLAGQGKSPLPSFLLSTVFFLPFWFLLSLSYNHVHRGSHWNRMTV